jgi:hypothetical protein
MPHWKCVTCRIRLRVGGTPAELVGARCPECGAQLEPESEVSALIGYRMISLPARERDDVQEDRWFDEDDAILAAALALPHPGQR